MIPIKKIMVKQPASAAPTNQCARDRRRSRSAIEIDPWLFRPMASHARRPERLDRRADGRVGGEIDANCRNECLFRAIATRTGPPIGRPSRRKWPWLLLRSQIPAAEKRSGIFFCEMNNKETPIEFSEMELWFDRVRTKKCILWSKCTILIEFVGGR